MSGQQRKAPSIPEFYYSGSRIMIFSQIDFDFKSVISEILLLMLLSSFTDAKAMMECRLKSFSRLNSLMLTICQAKYLTPMCHLACSQQPCRMRTVTAILCMRKLRHRERSTF